MERVFLVLLATIGHVWSSVVVNTTYGQVRGQIFPVFNGVENSEVMTFLGIPYAQNTSGQNRFMKPVPRDPWSGIFEANTLGEACPQREGGILDVTHPGWDKFGEDCLSINIYAPTTGGPYPVMFWIHGGGLSSGMAIQYPGYFLATYGIVVVTLNYRLNRFGYSYTGNDSCPGNIGFFDQKLALDFVLANILNFGGDVNEITVFGESAGGWSASYFMLSPLTKDLFHRAIMESGSEVPASTFDAPGDPPIIQVGRDIGCNGATYDEIMDCLRTVPYEDIQEGDYTCPPGYSCGFGPVVDGEGGFVPVQVDELRRNGTMKGPIISGINHDEMGVMIPFLGGNNCCSKERFQNLIIRAAVNGVLQGKDNVTREDAYQALVYNYSPWPYLDDVHANRRKLIEVMTDVAFGVGTDKQLKEHSTVYPSYGYIYNFRGRNISKAVPEANGVMHAMELPYVWGHPFLRYEYNAEVFAHSGITSEEFEFTVEDDEHALFINTLFTNFAKYGNPTPDPVANPSTVGGSTVWSPYTLTDMKMLAISNVSIEAQPPRLEDYAFWTDYNGYIIGEMDAILGDIEAFANGYLVDKLMHG